jgi:hypothetical protein
VKAQRYFAYCVRLRWASVVAFWLRPAASCHWRLCVTLVRVCAGGCMISSRLTEKTRVRSQASPYGICGLRRAINMGFVVYKAQSVWDLWSTNGSPFGICGLQMSLFGIYGLQMAVHLGFVVYKGHSVWDLWSTEGSQYGICGPPRAARLGFVVYEGQCAWNFWSIKWQWDRFSPSTSVVPWQCHSSIAPYSRLKHHRQTL